MDIQFKRGAENKRTNFVPKQGEPVFTTDDKELYIGDGSTGGGIPIGTVKTDGFTQGQVAIFKDDTGKVITGKDEADIIQGLATQEWVKQTIAGDAVNIKIDNAKHADTAGDSTNLGGHPATAYVRTSSVTDSYSETAKDKVVSAFGINAAVTWLKGLIDGLVSSKLDKTALSSSLASTSETRAATSKAVKDVNDRVTTVLNTANKAKTTADAAKASADSATTTANNVAGVAQSALTASQSASSKASSAESTANRALSTANAASTKAGTVETTANSARDTANNALAAANAAKSTANAAKSAVDAATQAAQTADGKATRAQSTANSAKSMATSNAGAITTAHSLASQAKSAAGNAQTTANIAKTNAANAQTTADTALATANVAKTAGVSATNRSIANANHLSRLPGRITRGTSNPTGGSDGDVYIQYS